VELWTLRPPRETSAPFLGDLLLEVLGGSGARRLRV